MKMSCLAKVWLALVVQVQFCRALPFVPADTLEIIRLNLQAFQIRTHDPEASKDSALKAIGLARSIGYLRGLSYSYNVIGNYYKLKSRYELSRYYYSQSLQIRERLRDTLGMARSHRNLMSVESEVGRTKLALSHGEQALKLLRGNRLVVAQQERAMMENALGYYHFTLGDPSTALTMITHARDVFMELADEEQVAATTLNVANIYEFQGRYARALKEYKRALSVFKNTDDVENLASVYNGLGNVYYKSKLLSTALSFYSAALSLRRQSGFSGAEQGSLLNMGHIYAAYGKLDSAKSCYQSVIEQSAATGEPDRQFEARWAMGVLMLETGNYRQALYELLTAQRILGPELRTAENSTLLKDISRAYNALGRPDSALFFVNRYAELNDVLEEKLRKALDVESTLIERNYQLKLEEEKDQRQEVIIASMAAAIVLLTVIFFLYYRFSRSKRNMQALQELVKDKELKALDAMLEGQYEERKRLAAELHDSIGSMLSATKLSFKVMEKSLEKMVEEHRGQYVKINSMLDQTMDSVRRISHNMASGIFSEKGIDGSLSELCLTFEQGDRLDIHLDTHGLQQALDYNTEVNIYRIVQELLTNIIRHADASKVTVQLIRSSDNINLTVEDNGRGFDPEEAKRKKGIGLSNVSLRVKKLNGVLNIDSVRGMGTTVIIDIPIKSDIK